jgi:hypothetical protein
MKSFSLKITCSNGDYWFTGINAVNFDEACDYFFANPYIDQWGKSIDTVRVETVVF